MSCERLKAGLPLVKIPVSGANQSDIDKEQEQVRVFRDMLASAMGELAVLYLHGVSAIIHNHNENVPVTKVANVTSFTLTLQEIVEEFEKELNDLTGEVIYDLERAIEDEE